MLRGVGASFALLTALGTVLAFFQAPRQAFFVTLAVNAFGVVVCIEAIRRAGRARVDAIALLLFLVAPMLLLAPGVLAGDDEGTSMFIMLSTITSAFILKPSHFWLVTAFSFSLFLGVHLWMPEVLADPGQYVQNVLLMMGGVVMVARLGMALNTMVIEDLQRAQQDSERAHFKEREALRASQRAEQHSATKSSFLASMSHELRTPLNAIIGYAELILEENEVLEQPAHGEDVRRIELSAKHLLALINEVLDLSKIEAGKLELLPSQLELAGLLDELSVTARPLMENRGNVLHVERAASLTHLYADPLRLKQVVLNLLSNAAKFTEQGSVYLAVEALDPTTLSITVRDEGIGMSAEHLLRVFEEFTQASATTTRDFGGTGLGLPIARRLCELMGGSLTAESTLGQGSIFTVTLPRG